MPKQRFSKLNHEKQHRILTVAAHAFAQHGYEGASYNQIIAACGVSKGAMYYYFEDKLDLYATIIQHMMGHLLDAIGPFPAVTDAEAFWEQLEAQLTPWIALYVGDPTMLGLVRSLNGVRSTAPGASILHSLNAEMGDWLEQLITEGQRVGAVRTDLPPHLLVALFAHLGETLDFWIAEHIDALGEDALLTISPQMIDLYRRVATP